MCNAKEGDSNRKLNFFKFVHSAYLGVSICNADVDGNHDKNSNGHSKVSNQTAELRTSRKWTCAEPQFELISKSGATERYPAGEILAVLELAQKESDEEAAEHQAHWQQGRVGEGSLVLLLNDGDVTTWMWGHCECLDDWVEGIFQSVIDLVVVQDQWVCCEDLRGGW